MKMEGGLWKHTTVEHGLDLWRERHLVAALLPQLEWRWHGIGALQAYVWEDDAGPELRVHLWSRRLMLPGILESGNAHNHRFAMRSTVLLGALAHTEWQTSPGCGYELYDFVHARLHTDDNRSDMRRLPGGVAVNKARGWLREGQRYVFERGAFHDSEPLCDVVVTLVEKLDQVATKAMVVAPAGLDPVPAFSGGAPDAALVKELVSAARLGLTSVTPSGTASSEQRSGA